ncbi:MAG: glutamyl-tRNA reductase [Thermaurantimonas sp.]|uniref:glutamyl-tRNA reductase n=1 Tax=Thermaurantimonas sp. TaxID=2681568 RepID=UPI0039191C74
MKPDWSMKYLAEEKECQGLNDFFVFGINYNKASAEIRGQYAIDATTAETILSAGFTLDATDLIILSTCNRTEVYGLGNMEAVIQKVSEIIGQPAYSFDKYGYKLKAKAAVFHLFKVAAGLDSQILGDFEIAGQLKQAAKFSKKYGRLSNLTERLVNFALQASKEVKSKTQLSKGTVSASYAAIELIQEIFPQAYGIKILLIGLGSFGENVGKNIRHYLPNARLTVANRTLMKAEMFAHHHRCSFLSFEKVASIVNDYDVVINTAAIEAPFIKPEHVQRDCIAFLDMSVPGGIAPEVQQLGCTYYNIDHISAILNKTLEARQAEVPKALEIIQYHIKEFVEWHKVYLQRWLIYRVKDLLYELDCAESTVPKEKKVQNALNHLVVNIKKDPYKGCHVLGAINEYLKN